MSKRLLLVAILLACPLGVAAEDTIPAADPTAAPTALTAPDTSGSNIGAAALGPQTNPGSAGGSNADSAALQPAGSSPVQVDQTGSILGASSSALQAPADKDYTLQVLAGEADGAPIDPDGQGASYANWALFSLLFGFITLGVWSVMRDRKRFADSP